MLVSRAQLTGGMSLPQGAMYKPGISAVDKRTIQNQAKPKTHVLNGR